MPLEVRSLTIEPIINEYIMILQFPWIEADESSHNSHTSANSEHSLESDEKAVENSNPASPTQGQQNKDHPENFEVAWDERDPDNPRNLHKARKWLFTIMVSVSSFCVTTNSTLYTSTYDQLIEDFHTTREVATLGLTTFVLGLAVGPMLLAPLSEFYGRRPVYIAALVMVFVWIIPCAVAPNMATIIVTRFFDGFFGSAFLSVAGGTIGDVFAKEDLSLPMVCVPLARECFFCVFLEMTVTILLDVKS